MATFYQQLTEHARQFPEREALDNGTLGIAFGDLPGLVGRYESCLLAAGVTPGSTVGLTIRHEIAHLLVTLALFKLQAHQVALASFETDAYRESLIERLNVLHLLTIDDAMDPAAPRPSQFYVRTLDRPQPAAVPPAPTIYSTTSGTTRGPRIMAATEELLGARADRQEGFRGQRVLMTPSVEHSNAKRRRMRCLYAGSTSLFTPKPAGAWRELADFVTKKTVTFLQISPLDANRFVKTAGEPVLVSTPIRVTGARISWALRSAIQQNLSQALYVNYGASECGNVAIAGPGEHDERETVGRPQPSVTVEIAGGDGAVLPAGEVGEIRIKAPGTIAGYHEDPVETAARFRGGWFYPGDLGSLTKAGELILHGRRDDMMIMNSINIYPMEIERVFEAHPAVSAAAAFAIKSGLHGDIPAVAIELSGREAATENILMQYSRDRLGLRCPRKIVILDKMPRSATGKILKNEIIASFINDVAQP